MLGKAVGDSVRDFKKAVKNDEPTGSAEAHSPAGSQPCPNCHKGVPSGDRFCGNCGAHLTRDRAAV
jgi:Double zinc ribbon